MANTRQSVLAPPRSCAQPVHIQCLWLHVRCCLCLLLLLLPQDFARAIATMEPLPLTPETEAQWAQLAKVALEHELLAIAERCYAAVGDIAKARFLHKVGAPGVLGDLDSQWGLMCTMVGGLDSVLCKSATSIHSIHAKQAVNVSPRHPFVRDNVSACPVSTAWRLDRDLACCFMAATLLTAGQDGGCFP